MLFFQRYHGLNVDLYLVVVKLMLINFHGVRSKQMFPM